MFKLFLLFSLIISTTTYSSASDCDALWKSNAKDSHCEFFPFSTFVKYPVTSIIGNSPDSTFIDAKIRSGYMEENKDVNFKGNILYFEGLGDSMLNHRPLFKSLTANGFRVIAFDYMGQGGSTGSMNDTRMKDIPKLGILVYQRLARDIEHFRKPIILGWSTGGLAAYLAALNDQADKIILLAPGIVPRLILGEQDILELSFDKITLNTLTSKRYLPNEYNPHVDGIRPSSPLVVKDFATDLILTSIKARNSVVSKNVKGLVLFSGQKDSYVHSIWGQQRLKSIAPSFKQVVYAHSLHEIDNEITSIQQDVQKQILAFLNTL